MKPPLVALALALFCSHARAPVSDTLAWRATKGDRLSKHFETSMSLEQQSVSITVGGRELPAEMLAQFEVSLFMSGTLEIEDEYVAVDDERPTELVRRFRKATQTKKEHQSVPGKEPTDKDEELESPLVDHAVVFTWNLADESYARAFREGEGEEEWLTPLEPDMDLRALLPASAVEEGETWKIEPELFRALTSPGGHLFLPSKKKEIDFDANAQGTIEATYAGKREVEGHELCVIEFAAHLSSAAEKESDTGPPLKCEIDTNLTGEFLWDAAQGHLHSFELSGPVTMSATGEREIDVKGQTLPMKLHFVLAGEIKKSARFE